MAGDAYDTIKRFWEIQDEGDYAALSELFADDDETAWAQWEGTTNKGDRQGVGIYRVRDGKLTFYRDHMNP